MCEFKIIKVNDNSQVAEDILVLRYTEQNELVLKDVLGLGEKVESALILDVDTINQKTFILEHPLIRDFIGLMKKVNEKIYTKEDIEDFQNKLEALKKDL